MPEETSSPVIAMNQDEQRVQYLESSALQQFQWSKIRETLDYIHVKSPFYRRLFKTIDLLPSEVKTMDDFRRLPFTEKKDIQQFNDDFLCVPTDDIVDYCSTSGTLGEPVHILLSENDLQRLALNESLGLGMAGIRANDVVQLTTTMDKRFMAGLAYFSGARKLGAGIIRNGSGLPGMQWDTIRRFNVTVIIAVPSFILKMLEYAIQNGIDFLSGHVKKIICIGEAIRNRKGELNNLGSRIVSLWPVELYSTYASTEMQTCFTECSSGLGGHLLPSLIYPEITDEQGRVIEDEGEGELVITTFGVEAMPLLRYKTGDLCAIRREPCLCGRTTPRIMNITGRKMQMMKIKGTSVYPAAIFNILDGMEEVENYIVEVFMDQTEGDRLLIRVGFKNDRSPGIKTSLEEKLLSGLRFKPEIEILPPLEIQQLQNVEGSRKPVKFFDHRKQSHPFHGRF